MAEHLYEVALSDGKIDRQNNTIRQVSLMSLGKVRGHEDPDGNEIWVDGTTLNQVFECLTGMRSLKVKAKHRGSVFEIVGYVDQFEKTGSQVLGDLHFYDSEPEKDRLFEIAEKNPEHLGLSLEFDGEDERLGNKTFARCEDVGAVALAPEAAANKSLFEKSKQIVDNNPEKSKKHSMAKTSKKFDAAGSDGDTQAPDRSAMFEEFCKKYADDTAMMKKFDDFLTNSDGKPAPSGEGRNIDPNVVPVVTSDDEATKADEKKFSDDEKDEDEKDDDKKDDKVNESTRKEMEALETRLTKKFAASLGGKIPIAGVGPGIAGGKGPEATFESAVEAKAKEFGGDKAKATLHLLELVRKQDPETMKLYAASRSKFLKVEPKANRYL